MPVLFFCGSGLGPEPTLTRPYRCLIFAGLPSCMMWPGQGWGYTYMYSALDTEDDLENAKKLRAFCVAGLFCVLARHVARGLTHGVLCPCTVCTEANSTYIAVPNAGNPKSLQWDVDNLKDAFGGCGTDEDKVIRVVCSRTCRLPCLVCNQTLIRFVAAHLAFCRLLCTDQDHLQNVEGTGWPRAGRRD